MRQDAPRRFGLDRIEIEEAGPNPEQLAHSIHQQIGLKFGPVPINDIARELDIHEIRHEQLPNLEGALITTAERDVGSILVNKASNGPRRRFTIAHELCHFLNVWHRPTNADGFRCRPTDIRIGSLRIKPGLSRHERQELEANRFAIELLAPRSLIARQLARTPDLQTVLDIARMLSLSKEAAARRYVDLSDHTIAIVFSKNGRCRYSICSGSCGGLSIRKGDQLTHLGKRAAPGSVGYVESGDPTDWLLKPEGQDIDLQTLYQQDGFAMTLLVMNASTDEDLEDDGGLDDMFDRFSSFSK